jgi:predicted acylesterase/phospholipase RssA
MRYRLDRLAWLLVITALAGCSYVNVALNSNTVLPENRQHNHTRSETFTDVTPPQSMQTSGSVSDRQIRPTTGVSNPLTGELTDSDGYFVGLALSGGGSRASNFSAACMFELERIGMLQKVDYISSVSGGSLTAAYYCLNRQGWNPKTVQEKMTHEFATDMLLQQLSPFVILGEIFTDLDRSDLLAKTLRENLYTVNGKELTYADLLPDRPRLLINATDLQSGRRFVFCNSTFDRINSDLKKYPIAYAVAASSSVPVVLHQVTLRDFSTEFKQYRHLIDGGVTDNLGVETLLETFRAQEEAAAAAHLPDPYPHGAVFISIDARVEYDQDISSRSDTSFLESLTSGAGLTSHAMLDRASSATLDDVVLKNAPDAATAREIRDAITELTDNGYVDFKNIGGHRLRVAHIAFTQLHDLSELPFHSFLESVNSTSTYFNIDQKKAAQLYIAADLLMRNKFEAKLKGVLKEMNNVSDKR